MNSHEAKVNPDCIIRLPTVCRLTGHSKSAIDREVRANRFPSPFKLSADPRSRAIGWSQVEVMQWIESRKADRQVA